MGTGSSLTLDLKMPITLMWVHDVQDEAVAVERLEETALSMLAHDHVITALTTVSKKA